MLSLTVLGSGSSGNCAVIRTEHTCLLLDAGLSARQIVLRLERVGMKLEDLHGILLTHEHGDHTQGLDIICHRHAVPIFCTGLTRESLATNFRKAQPRWRQMQTGAVFEFQDLHIECFPVPHDAADPVGFVIKDGESRLGVLSDVGSITHLIRDRLSGSDSLFIEANYDTALLDADTKRPWPTKQRISGRHGHLSNDQAAELVRAVAHAALRHIVLGHLSDDCNQPGIASDRIRRVLQENGWHGTQVCCAPRHMPTPWMEVAHRNVRPAKVSVPRCEQLALFPLAVA